MELSLKQLTKRFGNHTAVNGICAVMHPGVYGLLGANGAGKTTLMRMICAVLTPSGGEVCCNGQNVVALGGTYRDLLGYLPQDFGYYPNYTARDFLRYIAAMKGIPRREARHRIEELIEMVGLSPVAGKKIRTFSGGMKQRLGIAQALLNDPQLLVLDEPTAGLDPKERVRFRNLLSSFARDKIILLSTHIVPDIETIADWVFLMKQGGFAAQGTVAELIAETEGLVWEIAVPPDEADRWEGGGTVANIRREGERTVLRILSEECPRADARSVPATLEDLYLAHFPDETNSKAF